MTATADSRTPLVASGKDRTSVIEDAITKILESFSSQAASTPQNIPASWRLDFRQLSVVDLGHNEAATFNAIDFSDDNPDSTPFDIGAELLLPLIARLDRLDAPSAASVRSEGAAQMLQGLSTSDLTNVDHSDVRVKQIISFYRCSFAHFNLQSTDLPFGLAFISCTFNEDVRLDGSTVEGRFLCNGTELLQAATFANTRFDDLAQFNHSIFSGPAFFRGASFDGELEIKHSVFRDLAIFAGTQQVFPDYYSSQFLEGVSFVNAAVRGFPFFDCISVRGEFDLRNAAFEQRAIFKHADCRLARVSQNPLLLRRFSGCKGICLLLTDWINWRWVRRIGELAILTRVSTYALVAVPVLAGIWGPISGSISSHFVTIDQKVEAAKQVLDKLPADSTSDVIASRVVEVITTASLSLEMPIVWLLAFSAAACVVAAQFLFQLFAPDVIKQSSPEELTRESSEITRNDGVISSERIRQAIEYIHAAADTMPHRRSAWFVMRQRRTVWIPDAISHYQNAIDESEELRDQEVNAEDRKMIVIEEGEKARYDSAAFEHRSAACLSGGLYILAGWFTLMLIGRQFVYVAAVSPIGFMAKPLAALTSGMVIAGGSSVIAAGTVLSAIAVIVGSYEPLQHRRRDI